MASKIIAFFNQSGGVGKTTLTQNLGYALGQRSHRVLLVDMDPQASLTAFMGLHPYDINPTIANSLLTSEPLPIHKDLHQIDLAPANISLSGVEFQLISAMSREWKLKRVLEPISQDYDFILVDCPPSLGILSILGLVASTDVVVPVQTQFKSFLGIELLLDTISQIRTEVNSQLKVSAIIPTVFARSNAQDKSILGALHEQLGHVAPILEPIPRATAFADASMERLPLALFDSRHAANKILDSIAATIETF